MKSTMAGSEVVKITAAQTATKHGTVQGQVDKASPWDGFRCLWQFRSCEQPTMQNKAVAWVMID
jgi:hypothetical protein